MAGRWPTCLRHRRRNAELRRKDRRELLRAHNGVLHGAQSPESAVTAARGAADVVLLVRDSCDIRHRPARPRHARSPAQGRDAHHLGRILVHHVLSGAHGGEPVPQRSVPASERQWTQKSHGHRLRSAIRHPDDHHLQPHRQRSRVVLLPVPHGRLAARPPAMDASRQCLRPRGRRAVRMGFDGRDRLGAARLRVRLRAARLLHLAVHGADLRRVAGPFQPVCRVENAAHPLGEHRCERSTRRLPHPRQPHHARLAVAASGMGVRPGPGGDPGRGRTVGCRGIRHGRDH